MIPAEFEYFAPRTLTEASAMLARDPHAKVLGGGMSLIPALKHRLQQPSALIDLRHIDGLGAVRRSGGQLSVGARVTHAALARAPELASQHGLRESAAAIGDVQVRNRGTLGGSLVHADPAADWPAAFLAFDGEAVLSGPRGERSVPAARFFTAMLTSAAAPDEILTAVRFTLPGPRSGSAYHKLRQPASGFALVGVAACVTLDAQGRIERAALGVTGVNPVPFRAASLESRLVGQHPEPAVLRERCAQIDEADPTADLHASAEYRAHILGVLAARALASAATRAAA